MRDSVVLSSRVTSTEDETTTLSENDWHQSSTDKAPYLTKTETSTGLVQLTLNIHCGINFTTAILYIGSLYNIDL